MRINRQHSQIALEATDRRARGTTSPPTKDPGASVVSINRAAQPENASLGKEISARLEQVRLQLQQGTYEINYDRLAENILTDELGVPPHGEGNG